ncbi:carboxypeptidase-like regulatory domain-containing protein [Pedobacter deserti]|uniref:carboxypeptidase-like regulatory domain-containing protein n=1 Tax=Pedobacter deserti TaxID=2817382 RepID=UPI00210EBB16|nr:carboxypeptidase-like regulatory domain-containing protein [Pedobacter sp. SYSU D00382]
MYKLNLSLSIFVCLLIMNAAYAQKGVNITGIVLDPDSMPLEAATVFINSTTRISQTKTDGTFAITGLAPGMYQISVSMIGHSTYSANVAIQNADVSVKIVLQKKVIELDEVTIGPDLRKKNLKIFIREFLGRSKSAKNCRILNSEAINFGYIGNTMTAWTDKFLVIENRHLGYQLRYLLTSFKYNIVSQTAIYDGQVVFKELAGSAKENKKWSKNRSKAYYGSMTHFLRSVFFNKVLQQGFIAQQYYKNVVESPYDNPMDLVSINPRPIRFDTVVTAIDSSLISFKFSNIYLTYNPKKAAAIASISKSVPGKTVPFGRNSSVIRLVTSEAVIDKRGSYADPQTFFIYGYLARKRVGDQLPFEYSPD